jgi:tRNA (guanine6-N2)-methyltransferase
MCVLRNKFFRSLFTDIALAALLTPPAVPPIVELLATTNGGIETIAGSEIAELIGADADRHHRGVVAFSGNQYDVYDLHYRSRTCHRIMEVLVDAPVSELEDVYDRTREADIPAHLPFKPFGVVGTRHGTHDFTSVDVAERVGQAVIDEYRDVTGDRLPVDLDDPTVRLEAYLYDDRFTLAIDLSGESLHKRPYRVCEHDAPLRSTFAYSMLRIAGYEADDRLIDPMAGSATIPIEAALSATDRIPYPGFEPAFDALPRYDGEAFEERRAAHEPVDLAAAPDIEAREIRARWQRCGRVNRDAAGVDCVDIVEADAREATLDADCVVTNLPFGIRVSEDLRQLYSAFADRLREGSVDRCVVLTTKPELMPLEAVERYDVPYGRLDATIAVYEP